MKLISNNIYWRLVGPILLVGVLVFLSAGPVIPYLIRTNIEKTTKTTAIELVETLHSIRNFYNKAVISKVLKSNDIKVTHLYTDEPNGIPAPATFLMDMAGNDEERDVLIRLTSPHPFNHRLGRKFDQFEQAAWAILSKDPKQVYTETNRVNGKDFFRVAVADTMNHENCVNCHNSHPASTKTDWRLGDTRGLIEVRFNITGQLATGRMFGLFVMGVFAAAIAGLLLFAHFSARNLTKPLGSVTLALHELAEDQQKTAFTRFTETNVSEVRQLTHAFKLLQDKEDERKRLTNDIKRLAFFDGMTGLSNKTRFFNLLKLSLVPNDETPTIVPVLVLLDIDRYSDINDTLGHDVGDRVLCTIAERLERLNAYNIHAARYAEDTFALLTLVDEADAEQKYKDVIRQAQRLIAEPVVINDQSIQLSASFGASYAPDHGMTADGLFAAADVSLGRAKAEGGGAVIYSEDLAKQVQARIKISNDLRQALKAGKLEAYFQPQYDLMNGKLIGAEALIRWPQDGGGFIMPDIFIPIAEQAQLIVPVGHYMIDRVCAHAAEWKAAGIDVPRLAINISAIQFMRENVADVLKAAMKKHGVSADLLEVEITESAMSANVDLIIERLQAIQDIGVEIALDDFGKGYSSLSYLQRLPLDRLKIDRSFVTDMTLHERNRQIIKTIIALGRSMELKVLAEGIETTQEGALLKQYGCLEGQGYYYARPMPADDFLKFMQQEKAERSAQQNEPALISA